MSVGVPTARATGPDDSVPTKLPGDRGAGAQREQPLRLAGIEHGPGHRPCDGHPDRPDGVDRQPRERHRRRVTGGHQQPLDEQDQAAPIGRPASSGIRGRRPSAAP